MNTNTKRIVLLATLSLTLAAAGCQLIVDFDRTKIDAGAVDASFDIAKPDNSVGWFETPDHFEGGVDPMAAYAAMQKVDCYIMGSKTYELAMELSKNHGWPYGETPTIVLTKSGLMTAMITITRNQGEPRAAM